MMSEESVRGWQAFGLDVVAMVCVSALGWGRPEGFAVAMSTIGFIVGGRVSNRAARTGANAAMMSQRPPGM